MVLDESGNPLLDQYVVDNTSDSPTVSSARKKRRHRKSKGKSKAIEPETSMSTESKSTGSHEGLTWDEEVRRSTGNDAYAELYEDLPDASKWVNPDWSRSDYLSPSIPGSYKLNSETDRDSIQVNALIYEVDGDYVFDDDEYATVIRNLRESERSETPHSQTRGAGSSQSRRGHRVTVEEVDDESDKTTTSRTRSYVGKGKGKSKPKKKSKKRKRPSLGMALEDLEGQLETRTNTSIRSNNYRAEHRLKEMARKIKKLEKKLVTQARSGYKAQTPKPYKGEADIDKYDVFIFNYKLFVDDTKLSNGKAVLTMSRFLEDKAATYFMLNVAPRPERHTMQSVFVGLYEYCFPPDFKDKMRRKYNRKCQGDSSVQDYFAELARLRMRLREIDDRHHVLRAWDGAARYIKVAWALKGISAETSDIDTLREAALDIERARIIKRSIEESSDGEYYSTSNYSQSASEENDHYSTYRSSEDEQGSESLSDEDRDLNYESEEYQQENEPSAGEDSSEEDESQSESYRSSFEPGTSSGGRNRMNVKWRRLSEEKKSQLRTAGLCFQCEKFGHISRNCPNFRKARIPQSQPSTVKDTTEADVWISSVMLRELDRLTRLRDKIESNGRCDNEKGQEWESD
ncbi:zinc knuckle protein [Rhizoctonia solani 123E]|uniref:Zinc knuckle protein n=1 Tax=Rhizoctonia solani 123E TaxID=1423351 RepID=A0A074RCU1_9AGAM|nr:zinc knuckle protein [Rhizoctonia solani 123E]